MANIPQTNMTNPPEPLTMQTTPPELPTLDIPSVPMDPNNPLAWILLLTLLLGNTDEALNALTNLVQATTSALTALARAIASLEKGDRHD